MNQLTIETFSKENSKLFNLLETPLWIFDIDNLRMYWANEAAVRFWKKKDLQELLDSDLSNISFSTRFRLQEYTEKFKNNEKIYEQWTFYPDNKPVTIDCICRGVIIEDNRTALFIEGNVRNIENIEKDIIRGVEAMRHTPVIITLYTFDGRLLMQNPAAIEVYNNVTGNNVVKGFAEKFTDVQVAEQAVKSLQNNNVFKSQVQVYTSNGVRWHQINSLITSDPVLGDPVILTNETDITEQKNAEEALRQSERKFRNFFDYANIGMAIQDLDGNYTRVNRALCDIFGYSEPEMLTKNIKDLSHPSENEKDAFYKKEFMSGNILYFEREKKYLNNFHNIIWAYISVSLLKDLDGKPLYFISQVQDITKRKWAENEIIKLNVALEKEVFEQTAELRRSNEELKQFAYIASHDLQEPLRMTASYVQLLQKKYTDKLDDIANEYIGFAVDGVIRMQSLLEGILDYSRIGNKSMHFEDIDFNEHIEYVAFNLALLIKENDVDLTYGNLPTLKADKKQMIQLFQNLISNSIKYRKPEKLHINISAVNENNMWTFYVKDNGIGIEEQYYSRIFTIFQRLHPRAEYAGNGIGLAICNKIVERHGGQIKVESKVGKGSTFYFSLPVQ
jgi:PAS domain S-box-containing protein